MSDRIAVMRGGRVVQIGTAQELYSQPVDSFVARFLGESNLVSGRVAQLADGKATLTVRWLRNRSRDARERGLTAGAAACALIRPEHVRPVAGGLPARIIERIFLGEIVALRLALPGDKELWSRLFSSDAPAGDADRGRLGSRARLDPAGNILAEESTMLTRRHLIAVAGGRRDGSASRGDARADATKLTFCSWGGALSDLEKTALLDPFGKTKGFEVVPASPTNYAKLKAMVESGKPEWDLVDVGGRFIWQGADLLETLDMSLIPNAKALDRRLGVVEGHLHLDRRDRRSPGTPRRSRKDKGPKSWKDFWDVQNFPGPRGLYKPFYYNYEAALLAAGMARKDIYPVTEDKVKLAMDKIRELKPQCEGVVDGGRAAAAAPLDRRAALCPRPGQGACSPSEGERARRHDLRGRHRLGQCLGGAQGHAERQACHGGDQLRGLARGAGAACSISAPTVRCSATRRRRGRPSSAS